MSETDVYRPVAAEEMKNNDHLCTVISSLGPLFLPLRHICIFLTLFLLFSSSSNNLCDEWLLVVPFMRVVRRASGFVCTLKQILSVEKLNAVVLSGCEVQDDVVGVSFC